MGRRKTGDAEALKYDIKTRVNTHHFNRLNRLLQESRYGSMSDMLRAIICESKITIYTQDESLSVLMSELVRIRKELNAIGKNANQITRQINASANPSTKGVFILESVVIYKDVDRKLSELFPIISSLAKKWLQK